MSISPGQQPQPAPQPQDGSPWPTPAQPHPAWQQDRVTPVPPTSPATPVTPATPVGPVAPMGQVSHLGAEASAPATAMPPPPDHAWTIMSSAKRTGWWRVPEQFGVSVALGEVRLDLREAELSGPVTTIDVHGLMGEVKIIIPDTCRVECSGAPILGDFQAKEIDAATDPGPNAPVVRVTGSMVMGSVTVFRTSAAVGTGSYGIDGLSGARRRREARRRGLR